MVAKSNPLVKYGIAFFAVFILLYLFNSSTPTESQGTPPPPADPIGLGAGDSAQATIQTLVLKESERTRKLNEISDKQMQQEGQLQQLITTAGTGNNDSEEFKAMKQELEQLKLAQAVKVTEAEKLSQNLNQIIDDAKATIESMEGRDLSKPNSKPNKNPLGSEFEIGNAREGVDSINNVLWVNPIDRPVQIEEGVFIANNWSEKKDGSAKDSASQAIASAKEKLLEKKPVFTVPENTSIIGSRLASRIVALVPKSGTVNPMGFKLKIPTKILAANGFEIPELADAYVGGYAVGNFSLSCARAYVTSFTFIFEDGRIAQVGSNLANSGQDAVTAQTLAVLTDTAGTECIAGEFHSDAAEFISTNVLMGTAAGAASAFAGAEKTVKEGADSTSTSSSVTGNVGKYVAGTGLQQGLEQGSAMLNELWAESWSVVVVDIGTSVNIEVKSPINVDYDPKGRKVRHQFSISAENEDMRSYWK